MDTQLTFPPQPDGQPIPQCTDITIVNDAVLEAEEIFRVEVFSASQGVSPDPSENSAPVEIIDDDSMSNN